MRNVFAPLVGAVMALMASNASATVIDFEDIGQVNGVIDLLGNSPYQGLNWNFTLDTVDIGDGSVSTPWSGTGPAHSGRQAVLNNNNGPGVITGATGAFVFNDVWIKSWFGSGVGVASTITGTLAGSNVFTLNFIQGNDWQLVSAGAALIDTLTIDTVNTIFLIDDLQINGPALSVPAPGALVLLGLGVIGLGWRRRTA